MSNDFYYVTFGLIGCIAGAMVFLTLPKHNNTSKPAIAASNARTAPALGARRLDEPAPKAKGHAASNNNFQATKHMPSANVAMMQNNNRQPAASAQVLGPRAGGQSGGNRNTISKNKPAVSPSMMGRQAQTSSRISNRIPTGR